MDKKFMYVGIENEFQLFNKEEDINFHDVWEELYKQYTKPHIKLTDTAMRTASGTAIYIDEESPEVCTPPIRVAPGFATKTATALYHARKELIDFLKPNPNLNLIGYSTHWNISDTITDHINIHSRREIMLQYAPALALFGLTPLSSGINLRGGKDEDKTARLELLTDYIENEDQTIAFLVLYAGIITSIEKNPNFPLSIDYKYNVRAERFTNMILDGRYSKIETYVHKNYVTPIKQEISAQTYLEFTYKHIEQNIKCIATPAEIKLLEEFIYGTRKLEIDKFKKYAFMSQRKDENLNLEYHPAFLIDKQKYKPSRQLPTSTMTFLSLLANCNNQNKIIPNYFPLWISEIDWAKITFEENNNPINIIDSIPEQEVLAEVLAKYDKRENKNKVLEHLLKNLPFNKIETTLKINRHIHFQNLKRQLKSQLTTAYQKVYSPRFYTTVLPQYNIEERITQIEQTNSKYNPDQDHIELKIEGKDAEPALKKEFNLKEILKRTYQIPRESIIIGCVGAVSLYILSIFANTDYIKQSIQELEHKISQMVHFSSTNDVKNQTSTNPLTTTPRNHLPPTGVAK